MKGDGKLPHSKIRFGVKMGGREAEFRRGFHASDSGLAKRWADSQLTLRA